MRVSAIAASVTLSRASVIVRTAITETIASTRNVPRVMGFCIQRPRALRVMVVALVRTVNANAGILTMEPRVGTPNAQGTAQGKEPATVPRVSVSARLDAEVALANMSFAPTIVPVLRKACAIAPPAVATVWRAIPVLPARFPRGACPKKSTGSPVLTARDGQLAVSVTCSRAFTAMTPHALVSTVLKKFVAPSRVNVVMRMMARE